ncbi:MAG: type II toxin-antitoxin system RatA family toxin [Gammaproteobacteria bacterium]|nr:type II toxin-antitoxin system RatA family toxin [Gammaproteobacteria bacterium]
MQKYSRQSRLPYTAEQLFELVLDVERYPEFVPGWHAVQILERHDNSLNVEQTLGIGPLNWRFTSHASFERPTRITIESTEQPFQRLVLDWRFEAIPDGCVVELDVLCAFRTTRLDRLSESMTPLMSDGIIAAFERRAHQQLERVPDN